MQFVSFYEKNQLLMLLLSIAGNIHLCPNNEVTRYIIYSDYVTATHFCSIWWN